MTFIVILIALLIERFFDWSHLRRWGWYSLYQQKIAHRFSHQSSYLILVLTILPILIIVSIVNFAANDWLYGLIKLLFQLFIFIYCLGPQNLWADTFSCINALTQGDSLAAEEKLKMMFGITEINSPIALPRQLVNHLFIEANRRIFAIVFWYVVAGPLGVVLYRTITLSATNFSKEDSPLVSQSARFIETLLDWIPVRILIFIFALGGHFVQVVTCWRKANLLSLTMNETLLTECGSAALGDDANKPIENGSLVRNAVSLLDRVFVMMLVIIAISVLLI